MPKSKEISLKLKFLSELFSVIVVIIGVLVIIGWALNIRFLLSPSEDFSTIKANVGICLILLGISLYLIQEKRNNPLNNQIANILTLIVFLISFLTICEYVFGINLFIDQILFKEEQKAILTSQPNRMAFLVAINLILISLASIIIDYKKYEYYPAQYLLLISGSITLMGLIGFLYGVSYFYYISAFTGTALYAAIAFFILFLGFLFARPEQGVMHTFNSDLLGSKSATRLLLPSILITLILGGILVQGRNFGLYQAPFAVSIFALVTIIITFLIIWKNTLILNKSDLEIKATYLQLEKSKDNLELEVEKRTLELKETNKHLKKEIKERERYEKTLSIKITELNRSNAELEQFAYVASHDLQEPLRMVSSYLQLIERRYSDKLDEDGYEFMEFAVDGADRMQKMINDLLIYSRITTRGKEFEYVDLNEIISKTLKNLEISIKENNADITYSKLPKIKADPTQMVQVFQNLIANSIRFRKENDPIINISYDQNEKAWFFMVEDNGIGIDPKYSKRIFEVFKRLHSKEKYHGTGIGLAIVKKIVERHGGTIWVESELNKGSKFIFTISKNPEAGT